MKCINWKGFTLIEVLMIIVVLGIMTTIAMKSLQPLIEQAREKATMEEMDLLTNAIIGDKGLVEEGFRSDYGYVGDVGSMPPNLDALAANPGYSTWNGPYLLSNFIENDEDYKRDAWGELYGFSGGVSISSSGGGTPLTKQFAQNVSDLTSNTVEGNIYDSSGWPPGDSAANVIITIFYPDGSGGATSSSTNPDSSGKFTFSNSIPIGNHLIRAAYFVSNDTSSMYVSVAPASNAYCELRFAKPLWSGYYDDGSGGTSNTFILSTTQGETLGGLSFADEDLVEYDSDADTASMFFDGSAVFSGNEDIDAVHILANGHIVLSTTGSASIGGVSFQDEDLVDYDPSSGTATIVFDGSAIFAGFEDLDAVHVLSNGHILLSTEGSASIGGLSFESRDLVEYNTSTGIATLYLDGSSVFNGAANINAVHVLDNGHVVMSVAGTNRSIGSLTFNQEDLVEYDPVADSAIMYFDGSSYFGSLPSNINTLHIGSGCNQIGGGSSSYVLRPMGNGSTTQLTSSGCSNNWECVDEATADGDASRTIRASNSYGTDLYIIDDPSDTSHSIISVSVHCRARKHQAQGSVKLVIYTNGTAYESAQFSLNQSYADYSQTWATNPNTGTNWTWQEIINLEAGLAIKGQNFNFPAYCTQVWVVVEYSP